MLNFSILNSPENEDNIQETKFGFLDDNLLFENEDFKNSIALQAAVTNAANQFSIGSPKFMESVAEELTNSESKNSDEIKDGSLALNSQIEQDAVKEQLNSALESGGEEAISTAFAAPEAIKQITDEQKEEGKFEQNLVETTNTSLGDVAAENLAFLIYASNRIHKIVDDQGVLDWITNAAGLLVPDAAIDWAQLIEGNPFIEEGIPKYIKNFRELPVEEKMRVWPQIEKAILDTAGTIGVNEIKAATMLASLIDPLGEQDETERVYENTILDLTIVGPPFLKALSTINTYRKLRGIIKSSQEIGAKLNAAAAADEKAAQKLGTTQVKANTEAGLINNKKIDPEYARQFAYSNDKEIKRIQRQIDEAMQNVPRIEQGVLFRDEIDAAKSRRLEEGLNEDYFDTPRTISVDVGPASTSGFDVSYKLGTREGGFFKTSSGARKWAQRNGITNPVIGKIDDGYFVEVKQRFNFKINDVEEFKGTKSGFWSRHIWSPTTFLTRVDTRITPSATRIEFADMALFTSFKKTAREIIKDTIGAKNIKSRKKIDDVLLEGDSVGITYSKHYLKNNFGLNDKEIKAYFGLRRVFDNMWFLRNDVVRKEMNIQGYKLGKGIPGGPFVKPYKNSGNAFNAISDTGNIWDVTRGTEVHLGKIDDVRKIYDRGDIIIRYPELTPLGGRGHYNFAIVPKDSTTDLPFAVTSFREGYVPKFNRNAFYFVKQFEKKTVNGKEGRVPLRTLRIASSKKEAIQIVEQEKLMRLHLKKFMEGGDLDALKWLENNGYDVKALAKDIEKGRLSFSDDIEALFDREMSDIELAYSGAGPTRGMFLGHRAEDLRYGMDSQVPERFSAFKSLQRNMDNLASLMARNEWRLGMEQRILNTWRPYFTNPRVSRLKDAVIKGKHEGSDIEQGFLATKNHFLQQIRIPTTREKIFQHAIRNLAEWAEGTPVPKWARFSLLKLSHRDPYAIARALAFHPLLGAFNFSQLYVQAQGASVAASVNPIFGAQASKDYMALRWVMSDAASPEAINFIAKRTPFISPDDLIEYRNLFIKSGFREVLASSADFEAATDGLGVTADVIRWITEKGLFFYREGELFNKGVSLRVAMLRWKKNNPGKRIDGAAEEAIIDDAIKLTLNMTRANKAWWQNGLTSIPTQFLQVHAKYIEAVLGKEGFTRAEGIKLLMGQIALYGSAGVPLGPMLFNAVMKMSGTDPQHIEPDILKKAGISEEVFLKYVRGGLPDALALAIFGADLESGGRASVANGVTELLTSFLRDDFQWVDLAGALGGTISRFWNGMRAFGNLIIRPTYDPDLDFTKVNVEIFINDLLKTASSWNNAQKAWFWYQTGKLESRYGKLLTDKKPNFSTAVGLALGFQPTEIKAIYEGKRLLQFHDEGLKAVGDKIIEMNINYLKFMPSDPDEQEKAIKNFNALKEMYLGGLEAGDREIIKKRVYEVITNDESELSKVQKGYADNITSTLFEDVSPLNPGPYLNPLFKEEEEKEENK